MSDETKKSEAAGPLGKLILVAKENPFQCVWALITLAMTIVIYKLQVIEPELFMLFDPDNETRIATAEPPISVYVGDKKIEGVVSSQVVKIWNRGRKAIEKDDVLVPVSIQLPDGAKVLHVRLLSSTRQDATGFEFGSDALDSKIVLRWRILEINDGAAVQVIYTGKSKQLFVPAGSLRGQKEIKHGYAIAAIASGTARAGPSLYKQLHREFGYFSVPLILLYVITSIAGLLLMFFFVRRPFFNTTLGRIAWYPMIILVASIGAYLAIYLGEILGPPKPPF